MSATSSIDKLLDRLGPIHKERVLLQDQEFFLLKPSESDRLQNDPEFQPPEGESYTPFWADIWPASRMLGKVLLHEPLTPGTRALEIGCGLGLPGVVALSRGMHVTFTDNDPCAVYFARQNAWLNGFTEFEALQLDWRQPPEQFQFPLLLGADLVYELSNVEPLVGFIKRTLAPGGVCLMTDQDRVPSHALRDSFEHEGLAFTTETVRAGEPGGRRLKGTLYRIRHDHGAPGA